MGRKLYKDDTDYKQSYKNKSKSNFKIASISSLDQFITYKRKLFNKLIATISIILLSLTFLFIFIMYII